MDPSKSVWLAVWLDQQAWHLFGLERKDCQLPKPWEVISGERKAQATSPIIPRMYSATPDLRLGPQKRARGRLDFPQSVSCGVLCFYGRQSTARGNPRNAPLIDGIQAGLG
jgi:hypothetical protein